MFRRKYRPTKYGHFSVLKVCLSKVHSIDFYDKRMKPMLLEIEIYREEKKRFLFVFEQWMVWIVTSSGDFEWWLRVVTSNGNKTLNSSDICIHRHSNVHMLLNRKPHWVYTERCYINSGVIQGFPALRKAVTTHVKKYRTFWRMLI